jgi:glutaredoxin
MNKDLLMYSRTSGCPFVTLARRVLEDHQIPYREIFIDEDDAALNRVLAWTGFRSVPTLVITQPGQLEPYRAFDPLEPGASPRGIDRGPMITEPTIAQLTHWLQQNQFITN